MKNVTQEQKTQRWQLITLIVLFTSYTAAYSCIFTVGLTSPLIMKDLKLNESQFSYILTVARALRIIPKLLSGILVDHFGGKTMLLIGEFLTFLFTFLFAYGSSVNYLTFCWTGNNISTTLLWPSLVKVSSLWFSYQNLGKIMGILSLSYLFGDGVARIYLTLFIYYQFTWRSIFMIASCTLLMFAILGSFLLKSSPASVGLPDSESDPNRIVTEGNQGLLSTIRPLVTSSSFWLLALQYGGLTLLRFVFNDWVALYFKQQTKSSDFVAMLGTVLFPLAGGFAALLVGNLDDKLDSFRRSLLMLVFSIGSLLVLTVIYIVNATSEEGNVQVGLVMILFGLLGFTVTGPYSLPSGALSIRFGGKQMAATMAGLLDAVGTIASMLSGIAGSRFLTDQSVSFQSRWSSMILTMIGVTGGIICLSTVHTFLERRKRKSD